MRFPVLLGTGDPDSGMGEAGVGDCWSCLVRAFLSISRSSCRLLHPGGRPRPQGLVSRVEGWELGTQLIGGEVKQVLGLDSDRSSLTGVGLILREGFVLLRVVTVFCFFPIFYLQASFHP